MNKIKYALAFSSLINFSYGNQKSIIVGTNINYIKSNSKKLNFYTKNNDDENGSKNINLNQSHFCPGLILGYNQKNSKFMFEGLYEYTDDQLKKRKNADTITYYDPSDGENEVLSKNSTFQVLHKDTHALSFKYGYEFLSNTCFYLKAALLFSQFKIKFEKYGITQSKHQYGFAPGIGMEYAINNQFNVRAEYNYRMYRKIRTPETKFDKTIVNFNYTTTIKPREHHFGLSLVYKFNLSK